MEEYGKTSFLKELAPDAYRFLSGLKPIALIYALVLGLMIVLSLFLQWGFIKFFLDSLMGWTLLSIPFIGVVIVVLDKEFRVSQSELTTKNHHQMRQYKFSKIWGIGLCMAGIGALYGSSVYKNFYAFQCQDFYLEKERGIYPILDNCKYIDRNRNYEEEEGPVLVKVSGKEIIDDYSISELCVACEEWAEDAEAEATSFQFRRR